MVRRDLTQFIKVLFEHQEYEMGRHLSLPTGPLCSPESEASELFTVDHGSAYGYNLMYEV